ncbi:hypothetical protein L596_005854 [Steinernema carpocapsae]|uniref:Uncharacterized protein n=1 Tax=Steinernema carpocapsae TaxID=34508 RepID=A0A4U8V0B8_STECR|nr:hypothetical protein L596_005854 [Steinernema carpocapsae]
MRGSSARCLHIWDKVSYIQNPFALCSSRACHLCITAALAVLSAKDNTLIYCSCNVERSLDIWLHVE